MFFSVATGGGATGRSLGAISAPLDLWSIYPSGGQRLYSLPVSYLTVYKYTPIGIKNRLRKDR